MDKQPIFNEHFRNAPIYLLLYGNGPLQFRSLPTAYQLQYIARAMKFVVKLRRERLVAIYSVYYMKRKYIQGAFLFVGVLNIDRFCILLHFINSSKSRVTRLNQNHLLE